jgi:isopentenyl-diphosphate Delta-isomerase
MVPTAGGFSPGIPTGVLSLSAARTGALKEAYLSSSAVAGAARVCPRLSVGPSFGQGVRVPTLSRRSRMAFVLERGPVSVGPIGGRRVLSSNADTSRDEVILVDEQDRAIGSAPKLPAHQRGLRHRAISVIIRDRRRRILLQQRAEAKYHSAGLWTNTCCSHPRPGEDAHAAATRRLSEEMGIVCALRPLFVSEYRAVVSNALIEHEIVHVFAGSFDGSPQPNPDEASDWRWIAPSALARDIGDHPERYTVWFRKFIDEHWERIVGEA